MPPQAFWPLTAHGNETFFEFLEYHHLEGLIGMLQHVYEVQGYGPLQNIPAYYGLLWVTPEVTNSILRASFDPCADSPVTAWSKGWGVCGDKSNRITTKPLEAILFTMRMSLALSATSRKMLAD